MNVTTDIVLVKATRQDLATGRLRQVSCRATVFSRSCEVWVLQFLDGPTGYESYRLDEYFDPWKLGRLCICGGTPHRYDQMVITELEPIRELINRCVPIEVYSLAHDKETHHGTNCISNQGSSEEGSRGGNEGG